MSKTVTLRLDEAVYRELREAAKAERRPLSNLIETAALARIREGQFVDDAEMAEILGNEDLMRRLKSGSRQARKRKGRFVA
jgi:predicted transcriptional regulator